MKVQIKSKNNLDNQQFDKSLQKQQTESITFSDQQIKEFLKTYELKNMTLKEIGQIYKKYALTEHFSNTKVSAIITIFLPAFTNIYYTFRPNSALSKIMPFVMPLICFSQYFYILNKDMENFCFTNTEDSKQLRQKYKVLYAYSNQIKQLTELIDQIKKEEEYQKKNILGKPQKQYEKVI